MIDTFELPSACVCHYKESFGFEFFQRSRVPPPFKEADCSNGGKVSTPAKNQFFDLKAGPVRKRNDVVRFTVNSPNAKSRPRRHPHQYGLFRIRRRELCTPRRCRGGRFGELCADRRSGKSQDYPTSIIRSIMRKNSTYKSPRQFQKYFGQTCKVEEPTRVGFRSGFSFDESPMCRGETRYIFPKVAQNVNGTNRFIVNTEEYKQGVTVVECHPETTGKHLYGVNTFIRKFIENI